MTTCFCVTMQPALQDPTVPIDTLRIQVKGGQTAVVEMLISAMQQRPKIASVMSSALIVHFQQIGKLDEFLRMARISGELLKGNDGTGP
jgi:hypothetical protein